MQQGFINLGRDNDGPAFDRYRRLYVNDNVFRDVATLQAPADTPPLGQTLGANAFTTWVSNTTHEILNTVFLEDSKIGPPSLPSPLEGALFVAADSDPNGGTPRSVDAWSTLAPNMLVATDVLFDFAMNFNAGVPGNPLTVDEFRSLGMAFDSQGDLWVTRHNGRQGYELLEFRYDPVDARFEGERRIELSRPVAPPDDPTVPNQAMAKISIVAGRPHAPFTDFSGDTIFAVDSGRGQDPPLTGYVYVIDEITGQTRLTLTDGLVPLTSVIGVAGCEWPVVTLMSSDPPDGWIDPLSELDPDPAGTPRIDEFMLCFSGPVFNQDGSTLSPAAFTVTTSGKANCGTCGEIPDPVTPTVVLVGEDPDDPTNPTRVRVVLDGPIPVGVWTTVAVAVENACGVEATTFFIDVAHLPVDVNQSRLVNIMDAAAFGTEFNAAEPNKKLVDTNRNGVVNIMDPTEFGNQWSGGAPPLATITWKNKELLSEPQHP